jgi:Na+-driven multidrug efflux pump
LNKDRDLTRGNPFTLIFSFAFSMMLGNIFQQLYTLVDFKIIGVKIGSFGQAAIGGTDWLIFLVNGFLIGLIQGFSVILGKKFGEKDEEGFGVYYRKAFGLCCAISVIFVAVLVPLSGTFLRIIATKSEAFELAKTYVSIIFLGTPFLVFYQFFAAVLRSRGNSQIPLLAMTVSSLCNIVLDLLFIVVFKMGIAGAALGTILSEGLVMIICGYHVIDARKKIPDSGDADRYLNSEAKRSNGDDSDKKRPAESGLQVIERLLTVGLPMALQSVITGIGGLIVIRCVNRYDISFLTGYTIAGKIYALLEIAASSYAVAVVAYVAQNYGAGDKKRIKSGVRASVLMGVATALVCSFIMIFFGEAAMKIFTDTETVTEDIFAYGREYLLILGIFFPLLYVLYIMRASLQGLGNTFIPMVSSFGQLIMRVTCALALTIFIGERGIFFGEITAWILADIILITTYVVTIRKQA